MKQVAQPLFKTSPGRKISSRNRPLKKPHKVYSMYPGQIMLNRYIGILKNKLPQFDLED